MSLIGKDLRGKARRRSVTATSLQISDSVLLFAINDRGVDD